MRTPLATLLAGSLLANHALAKPLEIVLGSKKFTESYVPVRTGQTQRLEKAGFHVEHRQGMGGTIVLWEALKQVRLPFTRIYTGTSPGGDF